MHRVAHVLLLLAWGLAHSSLLPCRYSTHCTASAAIAAHYLHGMTQGSFLFSRVAPLAEIPPPPSTHPPNKKKESHALLTTPPHAGPPLPASPSIMSAQYSDRTWYPPGP